MNTTRITRWLSQKELMYHEVYLLTDKQGKNFLKSYHYRDDGEYQWVFTEDPMEAQCFKDFDVAYGLAMRCAASIPDTPVFVMTGKEKGRGKRRRLLLSEEIYFS